MIERSFLDSLAASASTSFGQLADRVFGPRVHDPVLGTVTGADLGVFLCCLAIVLLIHSVAAAFLRRKARLHTDEKGPANWRSQMVYLLSKPLYLLIWILGIYLARDRSS